jgi:class 3 adenylate cyclase
LPFFALVADIAGFTAWSSIREPPQVFTLLEAIFQAFDTLAKKHSIFKVETIGDCYVGEFDIAMSRNPTQEPPATYTKSLVLLYL